MRNWLSKPHPMLYAASSAIYLGMSIAAASIGEDLPAAFFGSAGLFMGGRPGGFSEPRGIDVV